MKVYALWNIKKKAFWSGGHGCAGGVTIVSFNTKEEALRFLGNLSYGKGEDYKVRGISVGG